MEVVKNVLLNWVLPVILLISVLGGIQALQKPKVELDAGGLAPQFELSDTQGDAVSLADFRGRSVIVNFWGTWCGPCKAELPGLNSFARSHPDVVVLGLAVDSGGERELAQAKTQLGIVFPVLISTNQVKRQYGVSKVPTTFFVDADGALRKSHVGVISPTKLAAWVD